MGNELLKIIAHPDKSEPSNWNLICPCGREYTLKNMRNDVKHKMICHFCNSEFEIVVENINTIGD
jgi:hypothetical protein